MFKLCILALASISLAAASGHRIRGEIVDASGAVIGGASVDLFDFDLKMAAHVTADAGGKFQIEIVIGPLSSETAQLGAKVLHNFSPLSMTEFSAVLRRLL